MRRSGLCPAIPGIMNERPNHPAAEISGSLFRHPEVYDSNNARHVITKMQIKSARKDAETQRLRKEEQDRFFPTDQKKIQPLMNANTRESLFAFIGVHSRLETSWLQLVRVVGNKINNSVTCSISVSHSG